MWLATLTRHNRSDIRYEDHTLKMLFTRKKSRAVTNTESPSRTQPGTNICAVRTPSQTVFTQEYNELFVQQFLQ